MKDQINTQTSKLETLIGGRRATAAHEDGTPEEILIRQLRIGEYEAAFKLIEDEIAFTGFCCNPVGADGDAAQPRAHLTKAWAETLTPESYEVLRAAVQEVNKKGFFAFAVRKQKREQEARVAMFQAVAHLPPEIIEQAAKAASISPTPLPNFARRPA